MEEKQLNEFVGETLEEALKKILDYFGWKIDSHKVYESGIDIHATKGNSELAIECLNWDRNSYINKKRLISLLRNFGRYSKAKKILVSSYNPATKRQRRIFERNGVKIVKIGCQILDNSKLEIMKLFSVLANLGVIQEGQINNRGQINYISLHVLKSRKFKITIVKDTEPNTLIDANTMKTISTIKSQPNTLDVSLSPLFDASEKVVESRGRYLPNKLDMRPDLKSESLTTSKECLLNQER